MAIAPSGRVPVGPGVELDASDDHGKPLHFRVESVAPDSTDRDGDVSFYGLSVQAPGSSTWEPYCTPDAEGKARAIPVKGSWDDTARYIEGSDDRVTFACTSGAIGKCIRFGYKPWKTLNGQSLRPYHQACVRMVRADYCGVGVPHTKDGTRIDVWDRLGIQKREEQADKPEVFEAAWGPDGAEYLSLPRWAESVDGIVKECGTKLAGRSSKDQKLTADQAVSKYTAALIFDARYVRDRDRLPGASRP